MSAFVLTLVASSDIKLDERIINKAFIALEKKDAKITSFAWLTENACDIFFNCENIDAIIINKENYPLDYNISPQTNRVKKLLLSDMDSTIIEQECIDELAEYLNIKDQVAKITEAAMNNEINFTESLIRRVALLKGLDANLLEDTYKNKITITPGAEKLITEMKKQNCLCILVSGGFDFFTAKIASRLGFDHHFSNKLEIKDGKLTGNIIEPTFNSASKLAILNRFVEKLNITNREVIALGDGANDIPMLQNAGLAIAYKAKESVKELIKTSIDHTDLTSALYFQGINSKNSN